MVALHIACSSGDDDDDDDGRSGDWPTGLPDCGAYTEALAPFDIEELYETALTFRQTFQDDLIGGFAQGTAHVDGDSIVIERGDWSLNATWESDERRFPIEDGQAVFVHASEIDRDRGTAVIWIADENYDVLLFEMDDLIPNVGAGDRGGITFVADLVCRYPEDGTPPIEGGGFDWRIVFGRSLSGTVNGSEYSVDRPGTIGRTEDGLVDVYHIFNYEGETDADPRTSEGTFRAATRIQMVGVRD